LIIEPTRRSTKTSTDIASRCLIPLRLIHPPSRSSFHLRPRRFRVWTETSEALHAILSADHRGMEARSIRMRY